MHTLTKTGITIGTLGGLGGIAYIAQQQLAKNDISKKLTSENYELLGVNENNTWVKILDSYREVIKVHQALKFDGFNDNEANAIDELKKLCNEATKTEPSKDKDGLLYAKAKKWCTKPRKLTDILKQEKGRDLLSINKSEDLDENKWNKMLESYNESNSNNKFANLDLLTNSKLEKNKTTRDKLRDACRTLTIREHYEKDFEKELEQAVLWCSKEI